MGNVMVIPARRQVGNTVKQSAQKKLRVAAYCRVSTDSEEQETSYEAQVTHYTEYIQKNPEWELAGIFADESIILGTSQEVLATQGFPGLILIFIWPEICGPPGRMITKCAKSSQ